MDDNNEGKRNNDGRERGEWTPDMRTDGWCRQGGDPRRNPFEREWRPRRGGDERFMRAFFAGAFYSAAAAATLLLAGAMIGAALAARMGWRM